MKALVFLSLSTWDITGCAVYKSLNHIIQSKCDRSAVNLNIFWGKAANNYWLNINSLNEHLMCRMLCFNRPLLTTHHYMKHWYRIKLVLNIDKYLVSDRFLIGFLKVK